MKERRGQYENRKTQVKREIKAVQRGLDRILDNEIDYAVKSVRDLAVHFPKLIDVILYPQNREFHTASDKVYFKNQKTNWYVCLDIFWWYSTVRENIGERFEWYPYFDLEGNKSDGKDKRFHFWNTQKDKEMAFEKKSSLL